MQNFSQSELNAIHISLITRLQNIENLLVLFNKDNDETLIKTYKDESKLLEKVREKVLQYKMA